MQALDLKELFKLMVFLLSYCKIKIAMGSEYPYKECNSFTKEAKND